MSHRNVQERNEREVLVFNENPGTAHAVGYALKKHTSLEIIPTPQQEPLYSVTRHDFTTIHSQIFFSLVCTGFITPPFLLLFRVALFTYTAENPESLKRANEFHQRFLNKTRPYYGNVPPTCLFVSVQKEAKKSADKTTDDSSPSGLLLKITAGKSTSEKSQPRDEISQILFEINKAGYRSTVDPHSSALYISQRTKATKGLVQKTKRFIAHRQVFHVILSLNTYRAETNAVLAFLKDESLPALLTFLESTAFMRLENEPTCHFSKFLLSLMLDTLIDFSETAWLASEKRVFQKDPNKTSTAWSSLMEQHLFAQPHVESREARKKASPTSSPESSLESKRLGDRTALGYSTPNNAFRQYGN